MRIALTTGPAFDVADVLLALAHSERTRVALYTPALELIAEGRVIDVDAAEIVYINDQGEDTGFPLSEVGHIVVGSRSEVILAPKL